MAPRKNLFFLVATAGAAVVASSPTQTEGAFSGNGRRFAQDDVAVNGAGVSEAYSHTSLPEKKLRRHRKGKKETVIPKGEVAKRELEFKDKSDDVPFWLSYAYSYPPERPSRSKPSGPPAGKPGDGKPGDGKPGDGKPGDGKPGDGKPKPPTEKPARPPDDSGRYPTEMSCDSSEDDGSSDVGDGEGEIQEIEFDYGVETEGDKLCPNTIPYLEYLMMKSVADAVLICDDDDDKKKGSDDDDDKKKGSDDKKRGSDDDEGRVLRVFSTPKDKEADFECEPSEDKPMHCHAFAGRMTVVVAGDDSYVKQTVLAILEWNMARDRYVDALNEEAGCSQSHVVHVNYLGPDIEGGEDNRSEPGTADSDSDQALLAAMSASDDQGGLTTAQKVAIGVGALLLALCLCCALLWRRRRRTADHEDDAALAAKVGNDDGMALSEDGTVTDSRSIANIIDDDDGFDPLAAPAVGARDGADNSRHMNGMGYLDPDYGNLGRRHTTIDSHICKSSLCKHCNPSKYSGLVLEDGVEHPLDTDEEKGGMKSLLQPMLSAKEVQFVKTKDLPP